MKNVILFISIFFMSFFGQNSIAYDDIFLLEIDNNKEKTFEIAFGGDIMLSRTVGYYNKKYGYDRTFKNFFPNKDFSKDTVLFYNLESPFSYNDNDVFARTFSFKSNLRNMEVINNLRKKKNKMILSLANNHITNAGIDGLDLTIKTLDKNNIFHVGVSKDKRISYEKIRYNKVNICIGGYTYDGKDIKRKNETFFINKINEEKILKDIEKMRNDSCDFKIISLHWGSEYKFKPAKWQRDLAHKIVDSGVDLILGHHSHIPGEIENYKGKYIYYSLGNFIFDQNWGKTYKDKSMDTIYDEKLKRNTIPTYVGNTFYHKYKINGENVKLVETKNIKHRIDNGILEKY